MKVYLIGSMRNPEIPHLAKRLREIGFEVFDDWHSPGPEADDKWQEYEKIRGRGYKEALAGYHAKHVYAIDKHHLDDSDVAVLVMPAGRSGHLELGYMIGCGKLGFILFDEEPDRYDVMYQFADDVFFSEETLIEELIKKARVLGKPVHGDDFDVVG